jgi:hypothetical protein
LNIDIAKPVALGKIRARSASAPKTVVEPVGRALQYPLSRIREGETYPNLDALGRPPAETESGSLTGEVGADHIGEAIAHHDNMRTRGACPPADLSERKSLFLGVSTVPLAHQAFRLDGAGRSKRD